MFALFLQRLKKLILVGLVRVVIRNRVECGKNVGRRTRKNWKSKRVRMKLRER